MNTAIKKSLNKIKKNRHVIIQTISDVTIIRLSEFCPWATRCVDIF